MKIKNCILLGALALSCASCELLQPNDIINPNVDEKTFLQTPNAMSTWVNGANRSFATIIGTYVELIEIRVLTNLPLFYLQAIFLIVLSFLFYPLFEILETCQCYLWHWQVFG